MGMSSEWVAVMEPVVSCSVAEVHSKTEDRELYLSKTGNSSNCKNVSAV